MIPPGGLLLSERKRPDEGSRASAAATATEIDTPFRPRVSFVSQAQLTAMATSGLKPSHGIAFRPRFAVRPVRGTRRRASRSSAWRIRSIRPLTVSPRASRSRQSAADHWKCAASSARRTARGSASKASLTFLRRDRSLALSCRHSGYSSVLRRSPRKYPRRGLSRCLRAYEIW